MPIYKVGDKKYNVPQEELEGFLAEFPKAEEFTEGKTSITETDTTVNVTEVSDTELPSGDGSSELPIDNSIDAIRARKNFNKQEEIAIMQDPIELEEVVITAKKPKSFDFWKQTVLSSDYEKAFEQLSKDTGEYSSVKGDGSFYSGVKNIGEYVKQLGKAVYQPTLTEEETTYDPINIDLQTRIQIAKDLTPKDLDKLKKGGYTLKEKEDLLRKSKSKVVEKALYSLEKNARGSFEELNEEQKVIEDRLVSTFGEIAPTSESFVTQASVDLYNNLNKRLNDISNQKKEIYKEYKADTEELEAEYGFNLASGVVDNSFKLTDEIKEFNKSVKENIGTDLSARLVGGLWKTAGDIVTFPGVVMGMAGDLFTDQDTYSSYDAFQDVLFNLTNYNTLGDPGEAEVLDEDGKYVSDPKQYARMTADMLPFTLGIIASAARGNTKGIQQTLSKAFPKRGIDKKLAQDISMGNAAFTMTFQDNVKEGENEGLSKGQAIAYGSAKSLGTAISQAVMPDVNFLKSTKGLNILKDFKGSLKSAANKKAVSKASGQFLTSIGKELGEEEIEFVLDKANKISFGLALGDYDGIVREQKQLFAGTLMLSGGLGSFGATATGKAVKKQIYNGIIKDQQILLDELRTQRAVAEKSGNVENAEQLRKAEIFATDLIRASKVSPENVTADQLDLVVEKQKLIDEKKKLDSSFHGPINEKIAAVDKQISESKVAQTKEEVAGKIKKGVEKLGEKLGFEPKRLKDNAAVEEYLNEVSPDKDNVKRAGELGFFVVKPDGSKEFVINEEANAKEGVITTEAHEALHYVLYESVKNSPESQTALGEALIEELKKIDQGQIAGSDFANRLSSYLSDPDITTSEALEEALTLFSEATLTGDIVYNENVMTKIGNFIRQTLQAIGIGQQIVFNDGRDVFNFIKDYNNSIKKGRADNFITEVAKKPVGKLVKPKTKTDSKTEVKESRIISPQAIDLKDALSNEELVESINSPTTEDKFSVAQAIVEKNFGLIRDSNVLTFEKNNPTQINAVKEILEEQILGVFEGSGRGKYSARKTGLFNSYESTKEDGASPSTYLLGVIKTRKPEIDVALKERAGVTGEDLSKAEGVAVTESTPTPVDTKKIKPSSLLPSDIVSKVNKEVKEKLKDVPADKLTFKKLGNLAPEIIAEAIGIPVKKLTDAAANLSKSDASAIQRFISQKPETLIKLLPEGAVLEAATQKLMGTSTGVPKSLLDAFYTKQDRTTDPSGLYPFKLNSNLNRANFLEAFGIVDGKKAKEFSPRSAEAQRLKGIASLFGRLVTNEIARSEGDLSLETAKDVAAGKSKLMFSLSTKRDLDWSIDEAENRNTSFTIGDKTYNVQLNARDLGADQDADPTDYSLEFDQDGSQELTGKGDQFKALSIIYNGLIDEIKSNPNIATVSFNALASETSRVKLYDVLLDKLSKELGWTAEKFDYESDGVVDEIGFEMYKPEETAKEQPTVKFSRTSNLKEVVNDILENSTSLSKEEINKLKALKEDPTSPESIKIIEELDKILQATSEGIGVEEFDSRNEQAAKNWKEAVPLIGKLFGIENLEYIKPSEYLSSEINEKRTVDFFKKVAGFFPEISKLPKELLNALKATVATGKSLKRPDGTRLNVSWFNNTMKGVGKGDVKEWMGQVYQPNWGYGASTKKSPKGSGFKGAIESKLDQLTENGKKTLTVKQEQEFVEFTRDFLTHPDLLDSVNENGFKNGYELTVAANRKAIEFIYNNLGEYYFNAKDKKTALEDINSFLQMQTNHANGIIKGLVPVISVTTNPEANPDFKEKVKGRTKTHNEHMVELFNANQRFLTILSEGKKGFKNKTTEMVKNLNQSLISKKAQGIKDSSEKGGASGQVSSNQFLNTFFTRDFSDDQLMIVGEQGESVTDYLIKNYGTQILKNILDKVTKVSSIKADSPIAIELEIALNSLLNYRNLPKKNNSILPKKEQLKGYYTTGQTIIKASKVDNENTAEELKFSKSLDLNKDFNDIIENKTGIASDKTYARVKAEVAGANKGRFNFFIPPSAEDFVGLLYSTLGKGSTGDAQMAWYKAHLLNPFARAMENIANDRVAMIQDYKGLKKALKIVPKDLRKKVPGEPFTREQAVRVYIWDQQGMEIPGLSKKDQSDLVKYVNDSTELTAFADQLIAINKGDEYASPDAGWVAGTIDTDFLKALNTTKRAKYLEVWQQNVDEIFSETNLNKLEAAYGKPYRVAMENILHRMKTGRNRSFGTDTITGRFTDWLTNSVGAIMFFNTRSAVLQTISAVNFINFSDNNVLRAGQAFANQPQYWSDFKKLFNSPFLLDRRSGIKLNVNEADIAEMAKGPGNSARNVIAGLLKAGFLPTQLADSFAIASGGATFYRNRIKALKKEGLTESEAEEIAFRDFREIAEESQQSSRPDKISQQQAGPLGRVVLAFANTPAQYARLIKKAASDLKNGRGDAKTNISKIIYYGVAQNVLFSALQQALFAVSFGDEDEEEEKRNEKYFNIANGMADSILRGIGVGGAIASVVKNTAIKLAKEEEKRSPKYQDVLVKEVLQISPPISSKVGKLRSAGRSLSWNKKEMMTKGWSIDNPAYLASANVISAVTNLPADRAVKKITNLVDASNEEIEYYKRIALALGWSSWELGIDKKDKKKPESSTGRTRTRRITRTKKRRN